MGVNARRAGVLVDGEGSARRFDVAARSSGVSLGKNALVPACLSSERRWPMRGVKLVIVDCCTPQFERSDL